MKVVVNRCFGGFSISPKAIKRMAELNGKECYFFKGYSIGELEPITFEEAQKNNFSISAFTVPDPNQYLLTFTNKSGLPEFKTIPWEKMTKKQREEQNTRYAEIIIENRPENRADPLLVQVVEELGEEADGACASLRIVEIPDDVKWFIDDYDGQETIREEHRSW